MRRQLFINIDRGKTIFIRVFNKIKTVWFYHPYDLNDPLDLRPPYKFDEKEIESPEFLHKLLDTVPSQLCNTDIEKNKVAQEHWERIKRNPQKHFDRNRADIEKRGNYDPYGLFSTSSNELRAGLWDLISPKWIRQINWETSSVIVNASEDQVKNSPEYVTSQEVSDSYEANLQNYYGRFITHQ